MEPTWLTALKRIHALAVSGQAFHAQDFDQERYAEIQALSETLLSQLSHHPPEHIQRLLGPKDGQYVTPKTVVRIAVFRQQSVLLVKEKSDGKWALPGGYADVGLSPVENVCKELHEEAGLTVSNPRLCAVRHKAKGPYEQDVRDFYIMIFGIEIHEPVMPVPGMETSEAAFFAFDSLPELSGGRTIPRDIEDARRCLASPQKTVQID